MSLKEVWMWICIHLILFKINMGVIYIKIWKNSDNKKKQMSSELAQKDLVDENFEEFEDANDVIPSNVP